MQLPSFTTGAAVLLALVPSVLAGSAHIVNNCGITVYYSSVGVGGSTNMQVLPSGYSQSMGGSGSGVSIKLAPSKTGAITQLEFTMAGDRLNYDMSNINGNPFAEGGMILTPSGGATSDFPTCVPVNCPAGESVCAAAYNQPDDTRTLVCSSSVDLTLTLCKDGPMKRDESTAHGHRVHARHLLKRA